MVGIICTFMGNSIYTWHGAQEKIAPNWRALQQTDLINMSMSSKIQPFFLLSSLPTSVDAAMPVNGQNRTVV